MIKVICLVLLVGCQSTPPNILDYESIYNENGLTTEEQKIFDEFVKPRKDHLIAI